MRHQSPTAYKAHERKAQSHHDNDPRNAGSEEWREYKAKESDQCRHRKHDWAPSAFGEQRGDGDRECEEEDAEELDQQEYNRSRRLDLPVLNRARFTRVS
jgi:hypothetical protein